MHNGADFPSLERANLPSPFLVEMYELLLFAKVGCVLREANAQKNIKNIKFVLKRAFFIYLIPAYFLNEYVFSQPHYSLKELLLIKISSTLK
jgi:hypothetical protein